jgi:hypothetical protein
MTQQHESTTTPAFSHKRSDGLDALEAVASAEVARRKATGRRGISDDPPARAVVD